MKQQIYKLLLICFLSAASALGQGKKSDTVYLSSGSSIDITGNSYGRNVLKTYCYPGKSHSVLSYFETTEFVLSIPNDDYTEYGGRTPEEVLEHYNEKQSLFSFTLFSQKRQRVQLSPFEQQCIGVASNQPYTVSLQYIQMDMWRLIPTIIGLIVIWFAGTLAKNSIFYYFAGMVLGICASLLVVIAVVAKLFPRRPVMYGVLIGGWTIGLYILKQLVENMRIILLGYREFVLWYLFLTGLVSFLICYRIGPPSNPRSQHIIMWVLQAIGGALVYFSSWHTSACAVVLVFILIARYIPDVVWRSILQYARSYMVRRFPNQRRFLTMDEFHEQKTTTTSRSLGQLREYVTSPNCPQWRLINSLDDPLRFASFANGDPHLLDEEIEDYSRDVDETMASVSEEETEEIIKYNMYYRPQARRTIHRQTNQRQSMNLTPNYPSSYFHRQSRDTTNDRDCNEDDLIIDDDSDDNDDMDQE